MAAGLLTVALLAVGVSDSEMNISLTTLGALQIERAAPAVDGLVEQSACFEADAHVVIAMGAIVFVEPGGIEHLLGELVIAALGVGDDAIAVAGLERGVDFFDADEGLDGLIDSACAEEVEADVIEGLEVVGVNFAGVLVSVESFFESTELVEDEAHIHEPGGVIGVDVGGEADFAQGLRPLALFEELLGLFDPTLGIAPVVHVPPKPWKKYRALAENRMAIGFQTEPSRSRF